MRWLLPAYLLLVGLLPVAYWPGAVLRAWQDRGWPALFAFWQSVQAAVPFPLVAVLLPLMLLAVLGVPLLLWLAARRPADAAFALVLGLSVIICWLQLGWAPNYLRPPVTGQLQLQGEATAEQQERLADYLLQVLHDTAGSERNPSAAIRDGASQLELLISPLGYPAPLRAPPRQVPAGTFMSFGVAGSLFPPSLEALVDAGLPDWQQVATSVHELTHVLGVAREDDATLLASLAGLRSSHGFARYSLALDAFTRLDLTDAALSELRAALPERARDDLRAAAEANARYRRPWLSALQASLFGFWLGLQGGGQPDPAADGGTRQHSLQDYSLGASRLPLALEAGLLP